MTVTPSAEAEILRVTRAHGATEVWVFESRTRDDARDDSDLDLLVTMEEGRSLLDLVAIKQDLEDMLSLHVDVITKDALTPYMREAVLAETVRVGGA